MRTWIKWPTSAGWWWMRWSNGAIKEIVHAKDQFGNGRIDIAETGLDRWLGEGMGHDGAEFTPVLDEVSDG